MNSTLSDEITSINAIYGNNTMRLEDRSVLVQFPYGGTAIRMHFPVDYAQVPPIVVGPVTASNDSAPGQTHMFVQRVVETLQRIFTAGQPCMYDLFDDLLSSEPSPQNPGPDDSLLQAEEVKAKRFDVEQSIAVPDWTVSEVLTERKSSFVGRALKITSPREARQFIHYFVSTDKQAAKATHNIVAWRYRDTSTSNMHHDCDDDGESAAGSRLLKLLEMLQVDEGLVVVSRYYGGVNLGPARFRLINAAARDALIRAKLVKQTK